MTRHASRILLLVVGLVMPVLAACGAAATKGRFEGFWQGGTLALAATPTEAPAWTIQPASDIVKPGSLDKLRFSSARYALAAESHEHLFVLQARVH